jgi:hypothetical protein
MILLLSVFTPGVSIFKWVCGCTGKASISLIENADPCHQQSFIVSAKNISDCCNLKSSVKKQFSQNYSSCKERSCCSKQVQTLKLDEQSLNRFSVELKSSVMQAFILPLVLAFLYDEVQKLSPVRSLNLPQPPLIHLPSGKAICISLHNLLN